MSDFRRGESSRNVNRNNSRNSAALDALTDGLLYQDATSFFYQYCHNAGCAYVSAIMVPHVRGNEKPGLDTAVKIGSLLKVPVIHVIHESRDDTLKKPISVTLWDEDGVKTEHPEYSWRELAYLMQSYQLAHQEKSTLWKCTNDYEQKWGRVGRAVSNAETDFSFSNMIRSIPGVRHLDIDAVILCKECSEVELMIEASSDGAKNTPFADITKATRMTRRLAHRARAYTLLVQHHVNDAKHQHPVQVTGWEPEEGELYRPVTTMSWADLADEIGRIHERHVHSVHGKLVA